MRHGTKIEKSKAYRKTARHTAYIVPVRYGVRYGPEHHLLTDLYKATISTVLSGAYLVVVENTAQLRDDACAFGQVVAIDQNVLRGSVQEVLREKVADAMRLLEVISVGAHAKRKRQSFFTKHERRNNNSKNKKIMYAFALRFF